MPLIVPPPWNCSAGVKPEDPVRFRLAWTRPPAPGEAPSVVGVIMYNPALEGLKLPDGSTLDGATHRRVRALLAAYTEIRVANLSPVRSTKPVEARKADRTLPAEVWQPDQQDKALWWACEPKVVVAAWGAGDLTTRMRWSLEVAMGYARTRFWCWGTTPSGDPLHPSPLGRVPDGAMLDRWSGDL